MENNFDNQEKQKQIEAEIEKLDLYDYCLLLDMNGETEAAIELVEIEIEKGGKSRYWEPSIKPLLCDFYYYLKEGRGEHSYLYRGLKEDLKKKFNDLLGYERFK